MSAFILVFAHRYFARDRRRTAATGSRTCRRAPTPSSPGMKSAPLESRPVVVPGRRGRSRGEFRARPAMTIFSSLTNRIFLASALLTVVAIGVAVYRVNVAVTAQAENELQPRPRRGGHAARGVPDARCSSTSPREARLVADLPQLQGRGRRRNDPPTVQADRRASTSVRSAATCCSSRTRRPRARPRPAGCDRDPVDAQRAGRSPARAGQETCRCGRSRRRDPGRDRAEHHRQPEFVRHAERRLQPRRADGGTFKALTNSEIAFGMDGRVEAVDAAAAISTTQLERARRRPRAFSVIALGDGEYVARQPRPAAAGDRPSVRRGSRTAGDGADPAIAHRAACAS